MQRIPILVNHDRKENERWFGRKATSTLTGETSKNRQYDRMIAEEMHK
jgi:hypothetical protein